MKKRKRKIYVIVIVVLILCIFLFRNNKNLKNKFQDELIFFQLFSLAQAENNPITQSKKEGNESCQTYRFRVDYNNFDFKNIYLSESIEKDTLIREKIAPRNQGNI